MSASWLLRGARRAVQIGVLGPLLHRTVDLEVHGAVELTDWPGPAVIAANHASHLDTPVLVRTLPRALRSTTVAAVTAGYLGRGVRRAAAALAFATVAGSPAAPAELDAALRAGRSVLLYPEETRSPDGFRLPFRPGAAELALRHGVPLLPVGVRGTYAAMPRGRSWPLPGRSRVSVRYGMPLYPRPGETPDELTGRLARAVDALIAEDAGTWWTGQRAGGDVSAVPPPGSWRRVWQETTPPVAGGAPPRRMIWRR